MKIIIDSQDKISSMAASMIAEHAKVKPGCAMAFAAGRTTKKVYDVLTAMNVKELAGCKAFTVCEYEGLEEGDARSCAYRLNEELYSKAGITQIFTPNAENADKFDAEIEKCGGIELAVLGIGTNGHIGFNEPATPYDSVTMGLKTICESKNVILVAFGSEKAEIIHQLVYGKTSTYVPAAMLQMHMNMTLLLDDAAAEKIK